MKSQRAYSLIELLLYIAILALVLNLSFAAYFRYDQHTRKLRQNADDIVRAMRTGEHWREDVRSAAAPLRLITNGVAIPQRSGEIIYVFTDGAIWRQANGTRTAMLKQVKASVMSDDSRSLVKAWRWELELASSLKKVYVRPLFTFTAVPGRPS